MLEAKTAQKVNDLIYGMTNFCIKAYEKGESVHADDLNALANLIAAVNVPAEPPLERSPAVGFALPIDSDGEEDEE